MAENHSIQSLIGEITSSRGLSYSNRYKVQFGPPGSRVDPSEYTPPQWGDMDLLCTSFTWPGNQITSIERRIGTGVQKVAYGYLQPEISATFMATNNGEAFHWLYEWQQKAMPTRNASGYHTPKYLEDYVADLRVFQLDKTGKVVRGAHIVGAYPTTVNPVTYANTNENQVVELSCEFSYRRWYALNDGLVESMFIPVETTNNL